MGWNGTGGYTRTHNFSADASAGIDILASRVDAEFDDFASAMTLAVARNGQNAPTANLPMGGFRHTNVGAAVSAENYLRVREFISDVPIFAVERVSADTVLQASVQFYVSVSANLSPPDGARLRVRAFNTKASTTCALHLYTPANTSAAGSPHVAPIYSDNTSAYYAGTITDGMVYEFVYQASASAWYLMNPTWGTPISVSGNAKCYALDNVTKAGQDGSGVSIQIARKGSEILYSFSSVSISCSISGYRVVISVANGSAYIANTMAAGQAIPVMVRGQAPQPWAPTFVQGPVFTNQLGLVALYPSIDGTTVSANSTIQIAANTVHI